MTVIKNRKSISASQKYFDDLARAGYPQSADYQQVLFKPGKALQSRELNFLQSIINEKIKNSNDLIYKNGSIIFGCDIEIDGDNITIGDGVIYWDGTFFKFLESVISISGTTLTVEDGINVYLAPKYETIDYTDDSKLYDPAIIYKINKSIDGADRLKITFEIKAGDSSDDVYSDQPQIIHVGIINSSGVSLVNRYPFVVEHDKQLESKIISGLRVRNNPMREPFTISEDNEDFYNTANFEKSFVEVEEGSGIINGEEVINSESKVFQLNKNISTNESDKLIRNEKKIQSINKDLVGIYGDISYGENYIDKKTFMVDMLQPGKESKIKVRVPLKKTDSEGNITTEYKIFEMCTCEVADVFELWKNETYDKIKDNDEIVGIGVNPIPIDNIEFDADVTKYNVINGNINSGISTGNTSEFAYDTSDNWKVHLIGVWKIHGTLSDISTWKLEYMVVINKIYDAAGQEVNASGLKIVPFSLIDKNIIWPRESDEVIGNSPYEPDDFVFNDSNTNSLPGSVSPWVDSSEDDLKTIYFSIDVPSSWISTGKVPSNVKWITCEASNPFVFPGNLFNAGATGDDILNIPMGGTIYNKNGKFNIPALKKVVNPIAGVSSIQLVSNNIDEKLNNDEFTPLNVSAVNNYIYTQTDVETMFNNNNTQIFGTMMDNLKASIGSNEDQKKCVLFHEFYDKITIVYE